MSNLAWIFFSTLLVNNFTLVMFLGLCSVLRRDRQGRHGVAPRRWPTPSCCCSPRSSVWFLNTFVLTQTPFLRTIAFIVVIASAVQIVEMAVKKYLPDPVPPTGHLPAPDHDQLRHPRAGALPDVPRVRPGRGPGLRARAPGFGLTLALILMASIRERMDVADVPAMARDGWGWCWWSRRACRWPSWALPAWGARMSTAVIGDRDRAGAVRAVRRRAAPGLHRPLRGLYRLVRAHEKEGEHHVD